MRDAQDGVFTDYLWGQGKTTRTVTAATIVPVFLQVATPAQAQAVADTISHRLLAPGGLATSLIESGQQWDAPMAGRPCSGWRWSDCATTVSTSWPRRSHALGRREHCRLRD
jgi:neutral trehalase